MTKSNDAKRHPRRWFAMLFALAAIGVAVLVIALSGTGGGSKNTALRAARQQPLTTVRAVKKPVVRALKPAKPAASAHKVAKPAVPAAPVGSAPPPPPAAQPAPAQALAPVTPAPPPQPAPAPAPVAKPSSGIPQNNGGDADADNNGGPSDGDGNI